ncbi:NAD(P)H-binding protein [Kineosporia sp. NBRC 101677]|uniref:SDR family oxidoreductase n=1 Tax=Kineosporia sp. NBRC 101677 TaxID=3032197 RepID=UPI0025561C6D|nr:NAD(P)H-binding protein [Kineosporia sp. NBRC 101677]
MYLPSAQSDVEGRSLVIGAIGRALADELLAGGADLRVMCRRAEQVRGFLGRGIDAAQGSLDDSDGLRAALRECDQLFLNAPPGLQQRGQNRRIVDAAVDARVSHAVKISDANPELAILWAHDHARADEYIRRSLDCS